MKTFEKISEERWAKVKMKDPMAGTAGVSRETYSLPHDYHAGDVQRPLKAFLVSQAAPRHLFLD